MHLIHFSPAALYLADVQNDLESGSDPKSNRFILSQRSVILQNLIQIRQ